MTEEIGGVESANGEIARYSARAVALLGVCGLSKEAQLELLRIVDLVPADNIGLSMKVASGLGAIAEAVQTLPVTSLADRPIQAVAFAEAVQVTDEAATEPAPMEPVIEVAPIVEPAVPAPEAQPETTVVPNVPAPTERVAAEIIPTPVVAIQPTIEPVAQEPVPSPESEITTPDRLNDVGQGLIKELLDDKDFPAHLLTNKQASLFIELVVAVKQNAPRLTRPTLPIQYDRLRLRMQGEAFGEIVRGSGATKEAAKVGIKNLIKGIHSLPSGSPSELRDVLLGVVGEDNLELFAALGVDANDFKAASESSPEPELAQEPEREPESEPESVASEPVSEVSNQTPEMNKAELNLASQNMVKRLLGEDFPAEKLTTEQTEMLGVMVISFLKSALAGKRPISEIQYNRFAMRILGNSNLEQIAAVYGGHPTTVTQAVKLILDKTQELPGGTPAELKVMFLDLIDEDGLVVPAELVVPEVETPEVTETSSDDASDASVVPEQLEPPQADHLAAAIELCEQYWSEANLASLNHLLNNDLGNGDMPARQHIMALQSRYAPNRVSNELLSVLEWDTLSALTGYRLQSGVRQARMVMLDVRFRQKYEALRMNARQVFGAALGKLVSKAADDYDKGWAPESAGVTLAKEPALAEPTEIVISHAEQPHAEAGPAKAARSPLRSITAVQDIPDAYTNQLMLHFGIESRIELHSADLRKALKAFKDTKQIAILRGRHSFASRQSDAAFPLTDQENNLLDLLIGDERDGRQPVSFVTLAKRPQTLTRFGVKDEAALADYFTQTLQKVAKLIKT
jgi:hypothetical protein